MKHNIIPAATLRQEILISRAERLNKLRLSTFDFINRCIQNAKKDEKFETSITLHKDVQEEVIEAYKEAGYSIELQLSKSRTDISSDHQMFVVKW